MSQQQPDPYHYAKAHGLEVVVPDVYTLQLDIDDDTSMQTFFVMHEMLASNGVRITTERITRSKSGNRHVYLRLDRQLTDIERIAWQACLGSDRKRELLSLLSALQLRGERSQHPPTLLFERPQRRGFAFQSLEAKE